MKNLDIVKTVEENNKYLTAGKIVLVNGDKKAVFLMDKETGTYVGMPVMYVEDDKWSIENPFNKKELEELEHGKVIYEDGEDYEQL